MYHYQRVYDFHGTDEPTILVDRLWPRGISKARLVDVEWFKAITPSGELRKWYHQDPEQRFDEFAQRYRAELQTEAQQTNLQQLRDKHDEHGNLMLLTAAKDVAHSHIPVLIGALQGRKTEED